MFFVLFGTKTIRRDVQGSLPERRHCSRCGMISDFRRQTRREYFTVFFVPLFPTGKPEFIVVCGRCDATYYDSAPQAAWSGEEDPGNSVIVCPGCSGKMRIPVRRENAIRVTCPHCLEKFSVRVG